MWQSTVLLLSPHAFWRCSIVRLTANPCIPSLQWVYTQISSLYILQLRLLGHRSLRYWVNRCQPISQNVQWYSTLSILPTLTLCSGWPYGPGDGTSSFLSSLSSSAIMSFSCMVVHSYPHTSTLPNSWKKNSRNSHGKMDYGTRLRHYTH